MNFSLKNKIWFILILLPNTAFGGTSPRQNYWGQDISQLSSTISDQIFELGPYTFKWEQSSTPSPSGKLSVFHHEISSPIWESRPGRSFIMAQSNKLAVHQWRGSFTWKENITRQGCSAQTINSMALDNTGDAPKLVIQGTISSAQCQAKYTMTWQVINDHRISFKIKIIDQLNTDSDNALNQVVFNYLTSVNERIYGFGEQFTYLDVKGRTVPIISTEQGHLRGRQPYSFFLNLISPGAAGYWYTTYASMPYYMTTQHHALFLENSEVSLFDLENTSQIEIRLFSSEMRGQIIAAKSPLEIIEAYTDYTGRMQPLPDWIHSGAIIGKMGGTSMVRQLWKKLKDLRTPIAAFWLQDWVGLRPTPYGIRLWWNWQLDRELYPDWEELTKNLNADNINILGYINPFLTDSSSRLPLGQKNFFDEAKKLNYLVNKNDGTPYEIDSGGFTGTLVDLTNPDAYNWYKNIIKKELIDRGMMGWMADFGEALPFDARLFDKTGGAVLHNKYPELWAKVNREAIEDAGLKGQAVAFMRCGFIKSPGIVPLFWAGDQMTTWDVHDGIRSAIVGLLAGGLSGLSLNHADIGGLIAIKKKILGIPIVNFYRSKELLLRSIEMSAFTPIFRSHEGNNPLLNIQIDQDDETLSAFSRFAKIYAKLHAYRRELFMQASEHGYPVVRHLMLHFPDDALAQTISDEWLLGSELLVAPVVDPHVSGRQVYFPKGKWVHLWTGDVFGDEQQGVTLWVSSPIGQPPVFFPIRSDVGANFRSELNDSHLLHEP